VTVSFTVSEKSAGKQNLVFGHIGRPEVKFEKMKKEHPGRIIILNNP
jgi:hypothetical protein